ncbi:MAG: protein kinase [Myxococcota bacterium]
MSVIGLRVGPFEIIEPATVPEPGDWYRARRTGMTRRQPSEVLVKMLSPDAEGPERAALQSEFDNLRAMEDPRVPEAVALYEGIGALAISAPDGITFDDIVEARSRGSIAMTPSTLVDLALEVAETLQHAHHRNRHHGHLGGGNIRLSTSGKVHLFGFATGHRGDVAPEWISPERARGEPTGPATDQWSLAAILAGLISGRAPWAGEEASAAINGDLEPIVEPIERQWPALSRLFRRMLDPDPENRYPSMQPVRQELLALSRKAGGTSEKRDLGKLMARRVERTVTPDGASTDGPHDPAEGSRDPESPLPADLDEETEARTEAQTQAHAVDTDAVTVHEPPTASGPPSTAEEMQPPPAPRLPQAAEPPPVAARVEGADGSGRSAASAPEFDLPLVDERIDAVHPDLDSEEIPEVPEARRDGDLDLPGPAALDDDDDDALLAPAGALRPADDSGPALRPLGSDRGASDEDITDDPTERYNPALLRELDDLDDLDDLVDLPPSKRKAWSPPAAAAGSLDFSPAVDLTDDPDLESSDVGLPPDELARALAVDAERAFGEGPTAVPYTDVDDSVPPDTDPDSLLGPATQPPVDAVRAPLQAVAPELGEGVREAVREPTFEPPGPSAIQKYAPVLVLVMVLLMIAAIAVSVW